MLEKEVVIIDDVEQNFINEYLSLVSQLNHLTSSTKLTAKVATVMYLIVIIWKANSGGSEDHSGSNGLSELFET